MQFYQEGELRSTKDNKTSQNKNEVNANNFLTKFIENFLESSLKRKILEERSLHYHRNF